MDTRRLQQLFDQVLADRGEQYLVREKASRFESQDLPPDSFFAMTEHQRQDARTRILCGSQSFGLYAHNGRAFLVTSIQRGDVRGLHIRSAEFASERNSPPSHVGRDPFSDSSTFDPTPRKRLFLIIACGCVLAACALTIPSTWGHTLGNILEHDDTQAALTRQQVTAIVRREVDVAVRQHVEEQANLLAEPLEERLTANQQTLEKIANRVGTAEASVTKIETNMAETSKTVRELEEAVNAEFASQRKAVTSEINRKCEAAFLDGAYHAFEMIQIADAEMKYWVKQEIPRWTMYNAQTGKWYHELKRKN